MWVLFALAFLLLASGPLSAMLIHALLCRHMRPSNSISCSGIGETVLRAAPAKTAAGLEVRLLLGVIAYNLGNFLRRLPLPLASQSWSLTSLQQQLFKSGARLVRHARYYPLQPAESHLTQRLFAQILRRIERLVWHPT